jgi:hypothetical protein
MAWQLLKVGRHETMKVRIIDGTVVKGYGPQDVGAELEVPSDVAFDLIGAGRAVGIKSNGEHEVSGITSPETAAKAPNSVSTGTAPVDLTLNTGLTAQGEVVPTELPERSGDSGSPEAGVLDREIEEDNRALEDEQRERLQSAALKERSARQAKGKDKEKDKDKDDDEKAKPGTPVHRPPAAAPKR